MVHFVADNCIRERSSDFQLRAEETTNTNLFHLTRRFGSHSLFRLSTISLLLSVWPFPVEVSTVPINPFSGYRWFQSSAYRESVVMKFIL